MTPPKRWLLVSAVAAVAVYALLWVGYVLQWKWLTTMDSSALETTYRFGVARPGWVRAWDVICTVLGPGRIPDCRRGRHHCDAVAAQRSRRVVRAAQCGSVGTRPRSSPSTRRIGRGRTPALVDPLETAFPSGHALGVMVGVLAYSAIVWAAVRPSLRVWIGIARRGRGHRDRDRPSRPQRAPSVRRAGRMGFGLRIFRRVPAARAAVPAGHGSGRNTGSAR